MALRKIDLMHKIFGLSPNEDDLCKNCSNIRTYRYHDRNYNKCCHYGSTRSEASDWKLNQRGCGLFNLDYTGKPVIELVRPEYKQEEPIEGQMNLFEYMEGSD